VTFDYAEKLIRARGTTALCYELCGYLIKELAFYSDVMIREEMIINA
jgi:hypothetical protein